MQVNWTAVRLDPVTDTRYIGCSTDQKSYSWAKGAPEDLYGLTPAETALMIKARACDLPDSAVPDLFASTGRRIFCVGKNYQKHVAEMGAIRGSLGGGGGADSSSKAAVAPDIFTRCLESLVPCGGVVEKACASDMHDYEGELVVHIGKAGRGIKAADAGAHIYGFGIGNDGSVRDWQKRTSQFTLGKNWDKSGALSSFVRLYSGEKGDLNPHDLALETRLNGSVMQAGHTGDMIFTIPTIIHVISTITCLQPGDMIFTGTPDGVGVARSPQIFMQQGDKVEISIENIGCLTHSVG